MTNANENKAQRHQARMPVLDPPMNITKSPYIHDPFWAVSVIWLALKLTDSFEWLRYLLIATMLILVAKGWWKIFSERRRKKDEAWVDEIISSYIDAFPESTEGDL